LRRWRNILVELVFAEMARLRAFAVGHDRPLDLR
jgi:hypothetical protein